MSRLSQYAKPILILLASGALGGSTASLRAQQDQERPADVQAERWRAHYVQTASEVELQEDSAGGRDLRFHREPLHVFSNPAGGSLSHGALFLWTTDEQPQVVGAVWSRKVEERRRVSLSLHSLAPGPLQARRGGAIFWNPQHKGIEFNPWTQTAPPASSEAGRLTQMRNMVRSLEALQTGEDQQSRLRVLPQPLYRYSSRNVLDGTVFCWFKEWDPEIFAIVEARRGSSDSTWHVAFARFSNKALSVRRKGQELWSYDPEGTDPPLGGPDRAYFSVVIEERPHLLGEEE